MVAHTVALVWLLVAALAFLAPALLRGARLGDYELLSLFGWTGNPAVPVHNVVSSDQIQEMIPWTNLDWVQVHHGHLPLWNPYAGLGLPLAFNLQSAPFSLSTAVSYLFPLHLAYTATVVAKMLIAGTGVFFLGRLLGLRVYAATAAGTIFELSGAFTAWSGWPQDGVFCWLGWILGAIVLIVRGVHLRRTVPLLAVFVALSVLGGHPESILISFLCVGIFATVLSFAAGGGRKLLSAGAWVIGGISSGVLLSSPILLPGLQVIGRSSHTTTDGYVPLPHSEVLNTALATFYGLPVLHSAYFGSRNYYEAAVYVGIGALILAGVGVAGRWRTPEVLALVIVTVTASIVMVSTTVEKVAAALPLLRLVMWFRVTVPLDCFLAVLAGIGLQQLIDRRGDAVVRRAFSGLSAAAVLATAALLVRTLSQHLAGGPQARHERLLSLLVPGIQAITALAAAAWIIKAHRNGPRRERSWGAAVPAAIVVGAELVFLLTATPNLWSSSTTGFVVGPTEAAAQRLVGTNRLGFESCPSLIDVPNLGILTEANSAYSLNEFVAYDPVVPSSWYRTYGAAVGQPTLMAVNKFCGAINSVGMARRFGIGFILASPGTQPPTGARQLSPIGAESVFEVPKSGIVTLGPSTDDPASPETVVPYSAPDPASMVMEFTATRRSALHLHISDLPGWSATLDGHPLGLHRWNGTMLAAVVPAGRHRVRLRYRPRLFTVGLWVALLTAVLLATPGLVAMVRRRPPQGSLPAQTD